jgi:hypothetical protein
MNQVSAERVIVDLIAGPAPLAASREALPRGNVLEEGVLDCDCTIRKDASTGAWRGVELAFDAPRFTFLFGKLPIRLSARCAPQKWKEGAGRHPASPSGGTSSFSSISLSSVAPKKVPEKNYSFRRSSMMRSRILKRIHETFHGRESQSGTTDSLADGCIATSVASVGDAVGGNVIPGISTATGSDSGCIAHSGSGGRGGGRLQGCKCSNISGGVSTIEIAFSYALPLLSKLDALPLPVDISYLPGMPGVLCEWG